MPTFDPTSTHHDLLDEAAARGCLKFLTPDQIYMIDQALASVGEFGDVRLVVSKGRLRFVILEKSFDANKWRREAGFSDW